MSVRVLRGLKQRVSAGVNVCVLLAAARLGQPGEDVKQHHEIFMLIVWKRNRSPLLAQITPGLSSTANRWWSDDRGRLITEHTTFFPAE